MNEQSDTPRPTGGRGRETVTERLTRSARRESLSTAGELVEQGGLAGGLAVLLYVVVGAAFWSLIGWGLDHLLGTAWIVIAGAVFGASAGVYLGYLHMRDALHREDPPQKSPSETRKSSDLGGQPRA
ncbi:LysE family transporter [Kocuria sp.]|uniref:AtpZ/AtpI family protein n=1 Tax=Kocuria sp. TaxID=1871328 RepID=UPI0026DC2128|nr:LysE family transporter [Kocuria sp.]MDO4918580.1 LysE family transporter [Kocuria sp.]